MFRNYIRKADVILFVAIVIIGLSSTVYVAVSGSDGEKVDLTLRGELYGTYSLLQDRTIEVENGDNTNTVVIRDGKVTVTSSNCHNQVCVKHAAIARSGESIICLPHRLVVEIKGKGGGYDAISS